MPTLTIPCPTGQVSDGCHTFDELYEHRCLLFLALMKAHPHLAWRAHAHDDGSRQDGWWIAGMDFPTGPVSYHIPDRLWSLLDSTQIATRDRAPAWDGHTSSDVLDRLRDWVRSQIIQEPP
jgi:hypothetical protein